MRDLFKYCFHSNVLNFKNSNEAKVAFDFDLATKTELKL